MTRFDDRHEVVVTGPWTEEMADAVQSGAADRVVCNYALGFDEPDLHFLAYLPIRELVLLDPRIDDLTPVYTLAPTLQLLHATVAPRIRIELGELPNLRDLRADWVQVADTIATLTDLRALAVGRYRPPDLRPLGHARALESLIMKDRPQLHSLDGLDAFPDLTHLGIFGASHLDDISAMLGRARIERLDLQACPRLHSLAPLEHCTALRILNVAEGGRIDTAAPLTGLTNLEDLYLYDTTQFVDGDLTPIADLPRLRELRIQNRRHYRPSAPQIQASLPKS